MFHSENFYFFKTEIQWKKKYFYLTKQIRMGKKWGWVFHRAKAARQEALTRKIRFLILIRLLWLISQDELCIKKKNNQKRNLLHVNKSYIYIHPGTQVLKKDKLPTVLLSKGIAEQFRLQSSGGHLYPRSQQSHTWGWADLLQEGTEHLQQQGGAHPCRQPVLVSDQPCWKLHNSDPSLKFHCLWQLVCCICSQFAFRKSFKLLYN